MAVNAFNFYHQSQIEAYHIQSNLTASKSSKIKEKVSEISPDQPNRTEVKQKKLLHAIVLRGVGPFVEL